MEWVGGLVDSIHSVGYLSAIYSADEYIHEYCQECDNNNE
jgi:hypothetical protein